MYANLYNRSHSFIINNCTCFKKWERDITLLAGFTDQGTALEAMIMDQAIIFSSILFIAKHICKIRLAIYINIYIHTHTITRTVLARSIEYNTIHMDDDKIIKGGGIYIKEHMHY